MSASDREAQVYDVVVLGGGTGGTAAARTAAGHGAKVVMFNDGELGGLCILRGCMPTKTMLHAAHLAHEARHHATPGVGTATLPVDFAAVMANKDAKVARFKRAKIAGIESGGYETIDARASFVGPDEVEAGGTRYRFRKGAVIATGSIPTAPPIPGLDAVPYMTSDEVMQLTHQPGSVLVVGSGAIGLELAQFFSRIGSEVHLVSRRKVFADVDPRIVEEMEAAMRSEPQFTAHAPMRPTAFEVTTLPDGRPGVRTTVEDPADGSQQNIVTESLVMATGRRAAVKDLGLDAAEVELVEGRIHCGTDMRTSNPKVFVAGDASGHRQLLHVANWEGMVAGLGAAGIAGDHSVEQRLHMEVVFTDPPLATIGMNRGQAEALGIPVIDASARFPETGRAITMDVDHGVFILVARADTGEILGAQILGPRADDIIHTVSSLMYYRGTAADMLRMPWYHPTLTEVLLSLARQIEAQRS